MSATLWIEKETKRLARRSADMVKSAVQPPSRVKTPALADNSPIKNERMIPESLENGLLMTKISEKKKKKVLFKVDPDDGTITFNSSKNARRVIPIESIKEIRTGDDTNYYRIQFKQSEDLKDRWITVIYILDGTYKTLHVIAENHDSCKLWTDALCKLLTIRQGLVSGFVNFSVRQSVWERQFFKGSDKSGDQVLDFEEIKHLCRRLSANLTTSELEKRFKLADSENKGYLDYPQYQKFVGTLQLRPEIDEIYKDLCTLYGGKLDLNGFTRFIKECQMTKLSDTEIKSIFDTYAGTTPNDQTFTISPARFSSFLLSPENAAFSDYGKSVWQDMTQPISDYYISSSHNTYLVGNQLVGVSTIEGYIRALLLSCRSVELDIYDGDEEPVIYHGGTWTSKVSLRDICQAIAKYAFRTSPYPVIISAEVHCCLQQQDKLVDIILDVFKDSIIQAPVEGRPKIEKLPSPDALKYKFLLKAKNLYVVERLAAIQAGRLSEEITTPVLTTPVLTTPVLEAESSSSSSSDEDEDNSLIKDGLQDIKSTWKKITEKPTSTKPARKKMSFRLVSLLVYTVGVKCHGLDPGVEYAPEHIFSLSENAANKLVKGQMDELIRHTHSHLVRVYPKGTRVNSSNYEPHRYWAGGCQVVALNWQTVDLGYAINQAMFQRNGRSGYVLKPDALRKTENKDLLSKRTKHYLDVTVISAQQLPRLRDSDGKEIIDKSLVDPFVEVSLHIPEWTNSPFLPESTKAAGVTYSPSSSATANAVSSARTLSVRTSVVKNNGFNPSWCEPFSLPFDCLGNMKELIFIEFAVRHQNNSLLGMYCVPLTCMGQGYRHVPLHDAMLSQLLFSTLFIKIGVRDVDG